MVKPYDLPIEDPLSGNQRRVEIAAILLQNGWDVLVRRLGLLEIIPGGWRQRVMKQSLLEEEEDNVSLLPVPQAVRKTLEELGPTFVKLGQVLSTRADLLPDSYILELKKLQEQVTAVPWPLMEPVILQEWNTRERLLALQNPQHPLNIATSVHDIFIDFNTVPLAAGSLGQAYHAHILVEEKKVPVIVKVQRPGLLPVVDADIKILKDIVGLVERTSWGKDYNFMAMVDEFASVIRNELNFVQEAENTETIKENLSRFYAEKDIKTAQIYWDYTSQRMMTMAYIDGEHLERAVGVFVCDLAKLFSQKQMLWKGFELANQQKCKINPGFVDNLIKGELTHIYDHEALVNFTQLGMGISMIAKSLIKKFNIQYPL